MISGIYEIYFLDTDWFYIGSTKNFYNRKSNHLNSLRRGNHKNVKMQNIYNKHPDKFYMRLIEKVSIANLIITEQKYLDTFRPNININANASSFYPYNYDNIYEILDPNKVVWATHSLYQYEQDHNISSGGLWACMKGQRSHSKGYKLLSVNGKPVKKFKPTVKAYKPNINTKHLLSKSLGKKYLIETLEGLEFCIYSMRAFCQHQDKPFSRTAFLKNSKDNKFYKQYRIKQEL